MSDKARGLMAAVMFACTDLRQNYVLAENTAVKNYSLLKFPLSGSCVQQQGYLLGAVGARLSPFK